MVSGKKVKKFASSIPGRLNPKTRKNIAPFAQSSCPVSGSISGKLTLQSLRELPFREGGRQLKMIHRPFSLLQLPLVMPAFAFLLGHGWRYWSVDLRGVRWHAYADESNAVATSLPTLRRSWM